MEVQKIISEMTLEEKAQLCSGSDFWFTRNIDRLGVPAAMMTDGPCGLRKQTMNADHLGMNESVKAVSYPTGSCVACSFDRELIRRSGEALGDECQAEDVAVLLGPAVNIKRSPLCGRNFEYFSEDPYLAGEMAAAYIQGVQSKNVGTSLKHFAGNSQEHRRMTSDSVIDERTLREIYLPAFETAVKEAQPWTVMCSYNKLNGEFASENHRLLTEILRDEWGFEGAVVSDWGAVNERPEGIAAGLDLEMPGPGELSTKKILAAVESGALSEEAVTLAARRVLELIDKYLSGRRPGVPFDYEGHHEMARRMAAESMVLLKNQDNVLPISKESRVTFIGRYAQLPRFQGGGSSHVNSYKVTGAAEAAEGLNVTYAPGFGEDGFTADEALAKEAEQAAQSADCAVVFIGLPEVWESEGFDRSHMRLPECQEKLVERVAAVQPNTVVVVHCGGAVEMPWLESAKAVLYAYLGGEAVGGATVDILFGDVNPSGKLAETFPVQLEDNPSYLYYLGEDDRVEYREGIFVGYRYYDKKKQQVLFPFGHGLSYTKFQYSGLTLDKSEMKDTENLQVSVKVKNIGSVTGKEIVQLYVGDDKSTVKRPLRELKGFEKVELAPGEEKAVTFTLAKRAFAYYNTQLCDWHVETGDFTIYVGTSSRELPCQAKVRVESTQPVRKKFSLNSTIGDLMADPMGQQIMGQMMQGAGMGDLSQAGGDIMGAEAMMAMVKYMPLRNIISMGSLFSGQEIDPESIQALIDGMNA